MELCLPHSKVGERAMTKVKHACNTHCWGLYVNSQLTWRAGCSKEDVSCRCTHVLHWEQQCPELSYEGVYCVPNLISVHFRVTIKILEIIRLKLQLGASEMESLVMCRGQPHCTETYLTELSLKHTVPTKWAATASLCCSTKNDFYIHLGNRNKKFKQPNCSRTRK